MSNPLESKIPKEESARYLANLGAPERVWELIGSGLNLSEREKRELYHRACRIAASQIPETEQKRKLYGHGLNVLFGFIELPNRSPRDR